jgi:serine/threonine-protein kinase
MADLRSQLQEGLDGSYALERELGRGGMATVFLARDLKHDRLVALKLLHADLAATLGPERVQREIHTAARLQHPHILTVLDSGKTGGTREAGPWLWFTMPFVEGETLRERLARDRQLPLADAMRIAREAAEGLQYAHDHGVIHRDIKPENLLLTRDGNTLVADFGIARALGGEGDDRITGTGVSIGTPAYMSPEQTAGDRGVDARTDVYSLGAVVYEMLAGEPPYTGPTTQVIIAKRFTEPPPSLRGVRAGMPAGLDDAIRKALAPTPVDRFQTVRELAAALQTAAASPAVTVPRTAATTPVAHRRVGPIAAAALVLGLLIGVGVLFAWRNSSGAADSGRTGPRVLAVLPFENLGDSADAYFAGGLTDEVRAKLGQLPELSVIARGSSNEYLHTTKRTQDIARELGADYLLSGTVRWEKHPDGTSRVRVIPELVEIRAGTAPRTRWQEPFDAALTSVFQVQAEIAGKVASALDVALGDSVRSELAAKPTANLAAYDEFLRGEAASQGMSADDPASLRRAIAAYQRAAALDSAFVPAWARLSQAYSRLNSRSSPTAEMAQRALEAANRARALGPNRPDGALALGDYYRRVAFQPARAMEVLEQGLKQSPNNVDLLAAAGDAEESLGRWEPALARLERATRLDPRSALAARRHGYVLLMLRRYAEADAEARRAAALAPTDISIFHQTVVVAVARGDLDEARRRLRAVPPGIDPNTVITYFANFEDLWWLLDDAQQRRLLTLGPDAFDGDTGAWGLVLAQVCHARGDGRRSRIYADSSARAFAAAVGEAPRDAQIRTLMGLAEAYAGRMTEAVRDGERGVAMNEDEYFEPYLEQQLARIYLLSGQQDKAIDLLELLIRAPHTLSPGWLRIDPTWDPLRSHPRFKRLTEAAVLVPASPGMPPAAPN